jgi:hypothetical protein
MISFGLSCSFPILLFLQLVLSEAIFFFLFLFSEILPVFEILPISGFAPVAIASAFAFRGSAGAGAGVGAGNTPGLFITKTLLACGELPDTGLIGGKLFKSWRNSLTVCFNFSVLIFNAEFRSVVAVIVASIATILSGDVVLLIPIICLIVAFLLNKRCLNLDGSVFFILFSEGTKASTAIFRKL